MLNQLSSRRWPRSKGLEAPVAGPAGRDTAISVRVPLVRDDAGALGAPAAERFRRVPAGLVVPVRIVVEPGVGRADGPASLRGHDDGLAEHDRHRDDGGGQDGQLLHIRNPPSVWVPCGHLTGPLRAWL